MCEMESKFILRSFVFIVPLLAACGCARNDSEIVAAQIWPRYDRFGQISAVGVDDVGNVYVFHRGNRAWTYYTFKGNIFADKEKGPISNETVIVLNSVDGSLLKKMGGNFFYLPHGLTVDDDRNIWVTDVAMHQVFKFPPINLSNHSDDINWKPIISLGVPFEPGNDDYHFCKPTSVSVDKLTKEFYVSDGYCNGRIIKYDPAGNILLRWGKNLNGFFEKMSGYMLSVPHRVVLAQENHTLYVADREDFRVTSYSAKSGKIKRVFAFEPKRRIFSVAYLPFHGGLLFALVNDGTPHSTVSVIAAETGRHLLNFSPLNHSFTDPHDLALSPDGQICYVVEINPHKIWKIKLDMSVILHKLDPSFSEENILEEPIPREDKVNTNTKMETSSFLAIALVVSVAVISFLIFRFYLYKNSRHRRQEARRLILDDDEGGIQLT